MIGDFIFSICISENHFGTTLEAHWFWNNVLITIFGIELDFHNRDDRI